MEQRIQASLAKQGIASEKDLVSREVDQLQGCGINAAQLEERYSQLAKQNKLLFQQEIKNKRLKKIKSKLYHKLKKKDKLRENEKLKATLQEVDPEAAKEFAHQDEVKKAEERLRLRHGGHKKWARDVRRFKGLKESKEVREQY